MKALKSLAVMGGVSQQEGARRGEGEALAGTELRESSRAHHPSRHPRRVTREALNIAAQLIARMDLMDSRPNCLS